MYATEGQVYSSDNLLEGWNYEGIQLVMPGQKICWAPCVIELDEKFYMYYSSCDEKNHGDHAHALRVAVAERPQGPFVYKKDILPPFAIDPHVVQTPSGLYLFYSSNDENAKRAGTLILCDRLLNPFQVEGKPMPAIQPTLDEEIYMKDRFKPGQHWHTVEGAFYFYYEGLHYLMYSGACYQNPTYFIGYCTAKGPKDIDLRELQWTKYPDDSTYAPLLTGNPFIEGTGHNSVLFDQGHAYICYHGRDIGDVDENEDMRSARIDEMLIQGKLIAVHMTP